MKALHFCGICVTHERDEPTPEQVLPGEPANPTAQRRMRHLVERRVRQQPVDLRQHGPHLTRGGGDILGIARRLGHVLQGEPVELVGEQLAFGKELLCKLGIGISERSREPPELHARIDTNLPGPIRQGHLEHMGRAEDHRPRQDHRAHEEPPPRTPELRSHAKSMGRAARAAATTTPSGRDPRVSGRCGARAAGDREAPSNGLRQPHVPERDDGL